MLWKQSTLLISESSNLLQGCNTRWGGGNGAKWPSRSFGIQLLPGQSVFLIKTIPFSFFFFFLRSHSLIYSRSVGLSVSYLLLLHCITLPFMKFLYSNHFIMIFYSILKSKFQLWANSWYLKREGENGLERSSVVRFSASVLFDKGSLYRWLK